jgi:hypothetical protein
MKTIIGTLFLLLGILTAAPSWAQSHHKLNPNAIYQGYYAGAPVPDDVPTQTEMNAAQTTANAAIPQSAIGSTVAPLVGSVVPPANLPAATTSSLGAVQIGTGLGVSGGAASVQYGTTSTTAYRGDLGAAATATANAALPATSAGPLATQSPGQSSAAAIAAGGGVISAGGDASNTTLKPSYASAAITTSLVVQGRVDLKLFGASLNGTTDDSCAFQAAAAALTGTGIGIYIAPGEKLLMGGACHNIPLSNIAVLGANISDNSYPYGQHGSQIYITDTTNSPFQISGNNVSFDGVNFFWPNQIENLSGPIAYPPAFTDSGTGTHNNWVFSNDQITNAYDFFSATSTFGWLYFGPHNTMAAFDAVLILQNNPAENYMFDDDVSAGAYGSELHHYGSAGAAGVVHVATTGVSGGTSVIPMASVTGINIDSVVSGSSCIPVGSYVGAIGANSITIYAPASSQSNTGPVNLTCALAANLSLRFDDYVLLNYMAQNASVIKVPGNGTISAGCSNCGVGGGTLQWTNTYIHGFQNGILVQGGYLSLTNIANVSFEVEHPINIQPGSEFIEVQIIGGVGYFGYKGDPNLSNCNRGGAYLINSPAPAQGSDNYNRLSVVNQRIPFMEGPVLQATGSNINLLNFQGNDFKNWARFGSCPGQYIATVSAPTATIKWNENHTFAQTGTLSGVQILAAEKVQIEDNFLGDPGYPLSKAIDIETPYAPVLVQGNNVSTISNTPSSPDLISGTAPPPQTFQLGGTVTSGGGDVMNVTATGSFPGSPVTATYTTINGDGIASARNALLGVIEQNATMVSAGFLAGGGINGLQIALYNEGSYSVTWTTSYSGATTLTTPVAGSSLATTNLWDLGNIWTVPNTVYQTSGNVELSGSGSWTVPYHANVVRVKAIGLGGAGGNGVACASGTAMSGGAGGGSGDYISKAFLASDLTSPVSYVIPTNAGTNTSFGTYILAYPGGAGAAGACGVNAAGGGGAGARGAGGIASGATAGAAGLSGGVAGSSTGVGTPPIWDGLGSGGAASISGGVGAAGAAGIVSNAAGGSSSPGLATTPVSANGLIGANAGYSGGSNPTAGVAGVVGTNSGNGGNGKSLVSDEPGGSGGSGASIASATGVAGNAGASGNGAGGSGGGSCETGCTPGTGAAGGSALISVTW